MNEQPEAQFRLATVFYPVLLAVVVDLDSQTVLEATVLDRLLGAPSGPPAAVEIAQTVAWPEWRVGDSLALPLDPLLDGPALESSLEQAAERARLSLASPTGPECPEHADRG